MNYTVKISEVTRMMQYKPPVQMVEGGMAFRSCPNCNATLFNGDKYCHECGQKVSEKE